jgi:hypothetical protein
MILTLSLFVEYCSTYYVYCSDFWKPMTSTKQGLPLTLDSYLKHAIEQSENIFYVYNYSDINSGKTMPLITLFSSNSVNQEYLII